MSPLTFTQEIGTRFFLYTIFIFIFNSLRTSETNYLNESFSFYSAIRMRVYYSKANKEERYTYVSSTNY